MFEKLKSLLFEEDVELEVEQPNDSSETKRSDPEPLRRVEPVVAISEPVVEKVVKRIDIDEQKVVKPVIKPTPAPIISKPREPLPSKEYKPKAVISPMFGLTEAEMQRTVQIEAMTTKEVNEHNDNPIISPMFGEVKPEDAEKVFKKKPKSASSKTNRVNMTLEEMLNIESQNELEFTLFDVDLDPREFQSRENKQTIVAGEPLDHTDGLRMMNQEKKEEHS